MYIRTTKSRGHEYVQLCHNYRPSGTGPSKTKVLHNFGRKNQLDPNALKRLIHSLTRYLEDDQATQLLEQAGIQAPFEFLGAKQLGGTHLLDGVWKRLGLDTAFNKLLMNSNPRTNV